MSHSDVLKQLFPLELGGEFAASTGLEGKTLDAAQARAERLLLEMLPSSAYELLPDWERVTGVIPADDEPLQARNARVVRKLRELGDIKKPYYVGLARALGYEIYIEEYLPTMASWVGAGDELIVQDVPEILFIWNCHIFNQSVYHFHAGASAAGERLTWWRPALELEAALEELRPAHVELIFSYE